jgi:hypothetical protein
MEKVKNVYFGHRKCEFIFKSLLSERHNINRKEL